MSAITISPALRADVLVEAIPYLARFAGTRIVVKYGGNALADADEASALRSFADDVLALRSVGVLPVVVHGGGPQIGEMMQRLGMEPEFRDGLRVTDGATLDVARMVLVGKVNREIVGAINSKRAVAVGLSGEDAGLIDAIRRVPDIGFVGDVNSVDTTIINHLLAGGFITVVATIGSDPRRVRQVQGHQCRHRRRGDCRSRFGAEEADFLDRRGRGASRCWRPRRACSPHSGLAPSRT